MIKITDSYGVQTTESGYSIDFVGTYTDPLKHAVYPDRRDGALKSSIAKWVLGMMSLIPAMETPPLIFCITASSSGVTS
ncbi:hypothetical protein ACUODF_33765, partial [Escherichia coli]